MLTQCVKLMINLFMHNCDLDNIQSLVSLSLSLSLSLSHSLSLSLSLSLPPLSLSLSLYPLYLSLSSSFANSLHSTLSSRGQTL